LIEMREDHDGDGEGPGGEERHLPRCARRAVALHSGERPYGCS
jgi:hypothetical protein